MGHHYHFVKVGGHEPVSLPGARPAQGHSIGNAERFLPYFVKFRMNFNLLRRTAGMRSATGKVWI